jgi:2Fe-2S ferredoxin
MYTIKFKFEEKGLSPVTIENVSPDQSILEAALDNNIELHHNCGMVCACSTCHIYLEQGDEYVPEITDREEDFIDRARNPRITGWSRNDRGDGTRPECAAWRIMIYPKSEFSNIILAKQ